MNAIYSAGGGLGIRRTYKDSLFHMLFGTEANKANALALYNAINQTAYGLDDLEVMTISDVIYMGVKHDASVLVDSELSLWEHQSSFNPNMPLRGLLYFARLYGAYSEKHQLRLFSSRKAEIPTPRYFVFYNGTVDQPEKRELLLSDLYPGTGDVEVRATMLNINAGRNRDLAERCKPLRDYSELVARVRKRSTEMSMAEAIEHTVNECIAAGILADFLSAHREEVKGMLLSEYDDILNMNFLKEEWKEEAFAEGRAEGLAAGRAEGIEAGRAEGIEAGRAEGARRRHRTGEERCDRTCHPEP